MASIVRSLFRRSLEQNKLRSQAATGGTVSPIVGAAVRLPHNYSAGSAPPSHSFTVRSQDALASRRPSEASVMPRTPPVWDLIVLKHRPDLRSQNRIVLSSPALMRPLPSGVTTRERTHPPRALRVRYSVPCGIANNLIV